MFQIHSRIIQRSALSFQWKERVSLNIYNMSGKLIRHIEIDGHRGLNHYLLEWNTPNINGVLYYEMKSQNYTATRKMVVIK